MLNELFNNRQSCRSFDSSKTVSKEDLIKLGEAGALAPSACNAQPWKFDLCVGEIASRVIKQCQPLGKNLFASDASAVVVVSEGNYNASALAGSKVMKQDYRSNDIGLATSQIILMAEELGLSTCILGWFNEKNLKDLLNIKSHIRHVIVVGYKKQDDQIRPKIRKDFSDVITFHE